MCVAVDGLNSRNVQIKLLELVFLPFFVRTSQLMKLTGM